MKMEISPLQLQDSRPRSLSLGYGRSSDKLALFLAAWAEKIGGRTFDFVKLHWLGILNFLLGLFVGGALLAPVFRHLNMGGISKITYGLFGFFVIRKNPVVFFFWDNRWPSVPVVFRFMPPVWCWVWG
jgi:hypothetical protein